MNTKGLFSNDNITCSERSLHTPGAFARQNLLYVQEVGRLQSISAHRCIRENLDSYLFFVVLEGKGSLTTESGEQELGAGDCVLLDCMKHYEHISDEADSWKLAWVHFNGQSAKAYYELFQKYQQSNVFHVTDVKMWDSLIGELLENQKDKSFQAELASGEILLRLLNHVVENVIDEDKAEDKKQRNRAAREFLNEIYANEDALTSLEEYTGSKIDALNADFIKYYGIGVEEYIYNRRLNAAKERLRFTIKSYDEIAVESGLADGEAMQKLFVEKEGVTPQEYREKWAQWIKM